MASAYPVASPSGERVDFIFNFRAVPSDSNPVPGREVMAGGVEVADPL
jgi:hypothetical protein